MARTRSYDETLKEVLEEPADTAAYLNEALNGDDVDGFLMALRNVVMVHGPAEVAEEANISRTTIYKIFNPGGNPYFRTLNSILHAAGLKITVDVNDDQEAA